MDKNKIGFRFYGLIGDSEHFSSELKIANFYRLSLILEDSF